MKKAKRSSSPDQMDFDALLGAAMPGTTLMTPPVADETGNWDLHMRRLLKSALAASPLSIDQVAEGLTALSGRAISVSMIYSWTGQSRPHRLPAELIPAINRVVGNTILLQGLAEASGCRITEPRDLQLARLGQLTLIIRYAQAEQARAAAALGGRYA